MRRKLLLLIAFLVPGLAALGVAQVQERRVAAARDLTRLHELIDHLGAETAPALLSKGSYSLDPLVSFPQLHSVSVLDLEGREVASFRRDGSETGSLRLEKPVLAGGQQLGTIVVEAHPAEPSQGAVTGLLVLAPLTMACLGLVLPRVARPEPHPEAAPPPALPTGSCERLMEMVFQLDENLRILSVRGDTEPLGYGSDELVGRPIHEVLEGFQPEGQRVTRVISRDGLPLPGTVAAACVRTWEDGVEKVLVLVRDASGNSRRVRQRLDAMEALYRSLCDNAFDLIAVVAPDGVLAYGNPSLARALGYSVEALTALPLESLLHPDSRAEALRLLVKAFAGERPEPVEITFVDAGGTDVIAQGTFHASPGPNQEPTSVIGIFRDVTDRKRTEAELAEAEERFRHAQKMEAVGRLAGGVAHDFNNILTVVFGCTSALQEVAPPDSLIRDYTEELQAAAQRASALTRQLLLFSRKQFARAEWVGVDELVRDMARMASRLMGERIELRTVLEAGPGSGVQADRGQLEQVLMNLMVNARDAMPGGGVLTVTTSRRGDRIAVQVSDTGCGIPPEIQQRIFEPYFTTKSLGKGTGLGLSTAYGIVSSLEGSLRVESEPGQGTTFTVLLPATEGVEPRQAGQAASNGPAGRHTILLVEDDDAVLKSTIRILARRGYEVLCAESGEQGKELLETRGAEIDLLITDLVLPRMGGPELARYYLGSRRDGRVLCISGYPDGTLGNGGLPDGCSFLPKPFDAGELTTAVDRILTARSAS